MAHDVFISYSHKDKATADAVCANLEGNGVRCWIAPRDIAPGQDWPTSISKAIAGSRIMVLIFSEHSNSSEEVGRELILAANNKLVIIPFKIDNSSPEPGKEYYLARTHWLDAINPPTQEQIDTLVGYVESFLGAGKKPIIVLPEEKERTPTAALPRNESRVQSKTGRDRQLRWIWISILVLVGIGSVAGTLYAVFQPQLAALSPSALQPQLAASSPSALQPQSVTSSPPAPVTITVWHELQSPVSQQAEAIFDEYSRQNPNVKIILSMKGVNIITNDDFSARITDLLNASLPAGQGPDFIIWNANSTILFNAPSGNIVSLDKYGITQNWMFSIYEPVMVNGMLMDGKIWGLPVDQGGMALIYNKSLASESDFPANPMDLMTLRNNMEQYYSANGIPLLCIENINPFFTAPIFFGFGIPGYVDEQGKVYLNTPQALDAMDWLISIKPFTLQDVVSDYCPTAVAEGRVAALWGGFWNLPMLNEAGIQYGVLPMGVPYVGANAVMMTRNAVDRGNDRTALEIMKYFSSEEVQKKLAIQVYNLNPDQPEYYVPAQTVALEALELLDNPVTAGFAASFRLGVPQSNSPYVEKQWLPLSEAIINAWNGTQTPQEALAAAQAEIEAEIAKLK